MKIFDFPMTFWFILYEYGIGKKNPPFITKEHQNIKVSRATIGPLNNEYYFYQPNFSQQISQEAYLDLLDFYNNLYKDDQEFQRFILCLERYWTNYESRLEQQGETFLAGKGELSIFKKNFKYFLKEKSLTTEISKKTYQKINHLNTLLNKRI